MLLRRSFPWWSTTSTTFFWTASTCFILYTAISEKKLVSPQTWRWNLQAAVPQNRKRDCSLPMIAVDFASECKIYDYTTVSKYWKAHKRWIPILVAVSIICSIKAINVIFGSVAVRSYSYPMKLSENVGFIVVVSLAVTMTSVKVPKSRSTSQKRSFSAPFKSKAKRIADLCYRKRGPVINTDVKFSM